ncbi:hypothetical protein [Enterococcus sp. AZ072]|uniref:hypothetical protein n=1 Tax=unclassified Enterococcus TaxID=2608891 RepID=UPI003D2AFE1B
MQKKHLTLPFYCVNSQVLWKGEAAVENAVQMDQKSIELGLDTIFTASVDDVAQLNAATKRLWIGIVFEGQSSEKLEEFREAGAAVLIFDEVKQLDQVTAILQAAKKIGYLILVRTEAPFELPEEVLAYLDILKWKFDSKQSADAVFKEQCNEQKRLVAGLKEEYPQLAIIYGANTISSNRVLNSLMMGLDGVGEVSCNESTQQKRQEMLNVVNDYKKVQTFLNA